MLANLFLLLVSCLAGLSLCELSLRIFYPKYRNVAEAEFNRDAIRIWTRKPNSRSWGIHPNTGRSHFLHHNNLGLRQHRNFSATDLASATNIGFFGDSFTENVGLPVQYSFTESLQYLLNQGQKRFNVLNFGVMGYGTGQSFLHYENFHYAEDLDYVIYMYFENDLNDILQTNLFHLDDAGVLVANEAIRSSWFVPLISWMHLSYLILDVSGSLSSFVEDHDWVAASWKLDKERRKRIIEFERRELSDGDRANSLAIFSQLIRRWKQRVERRGGEIYVVLLPTLPEFPDVLPLILEENINVLNLTDCFGELDATHQSRPWSTSPYRFKTDIHWNEQGNKLAAVCLYRFFEKEIGIPSISEDEMQQALSRYYAAFEEGLPDNGGRLDTEGSVSLQTRTRLRNMILAFDNVESIEEKIKRVKGRGKRIIRSVFDVYLDGKQLLFSKKNCTPADLQAQFIFHVIPVNVRDLPAHRVEFGFDNLDFDPSGFEIDDQSCTGVHWLPSYASKRIRVGQVSPNGTPIWGDEAAVE